jgi:hypothetical protein
MSISIDDHEFVLLAEEECLSLISADDPENWAYTIVLLIFMLASVVAHPYALSEYTEIVFSSWFL